MSIVVVSGVGMYLSISSEVLVVVSTVVLVPSSVVVVLLCVRMWKLLKWRMDRGARLRRV